MNYTQYLNEAKEETGFELFKRTMNDIIKTEKSINNKLKKYQSKAAKTLVGKNVDYSYVGDLGHVLTMFQEIDNFLR